MLILAKNAELMLLLFTLNLVKHLENNATKTSKWRTYLPYLHLETLRVYNLLADDYKNTISTQTPSYARPALSPVERGLFLWDPGPINVTIDRQKVQKTVFGGKFSSETCKFKRKGRGEGG